MTVGSIIGGGIRFVRQRPQLVAIWAALYLAVAVAGMLAMRPWLATVMAVQRQMQANAAAGIRTPPVFPGDLFGQMVLIQLLAAIIVVVAFAAVVRAVARPADDRFAYLRAGMDELRLLGLGVLYLAAFFVAELVVILALVLIGLLIGAVLGKTAAIAVVALLAIAAFCGVIYAQVRISLAGAMTVIRRRIVIRDAWHATRGRFWTLFGAYLVLFVIFMVVALAVTALTSFPLLAAYASVDPQAIQAAAREQLARQSTGPSAAMIAQMAVAAIVFVALNAVAGAAVATAALDLGGGAVEREGVW